MNGQFKRCATGLQQAFPGLRIEGGPYTPPASVQYGIRAVRAAQVGAAGFFFFGEALFGKLGKQPPKVLTQLHDNKLVAVGGLYALDIVAQTLKAINAFEITYNGVLLHSKLKTGVFPDASDVVKKLRDVMAREQPQSPK